MAQISKAGSSPRLGERKSEMKNCCHEARQVGESVHAVAGIGLWISI